MPKSYENQYLDIAEQILRDGEESDDRTGVGTYDLFGSPQMTIDLREGLPLLTSKRVAMGAVASELTWMLQGDTNLRYLAQRNNHIWDEWGFVDYLTQTKQPIPEQDSQEWKVQKAAYLEQVLTNDDFMRSFGDLGPIYGKQWRAWQGYDGTTIDQLHNVQTHIRGIDAGDPKRKPFGRRLMVSAWNVAQVDDMALPPCHSLFQFNASNRSNPETGKKYLDMKLYQRSADWFLGVPFNMAQYAFMLSAMAELTDREPRYFHHTFGSAHIYKNHEDQIREQLGRRNDLYEPPTFSFDRKISELDDFQPSDFTGGVKNYKHHPAIKGQVAI